MDQDQQDQDEGHDQPLTVCLLDPTTVEVDIPELGQVRIMRFWDDERKCYGVKIANDLGEGVPLEVA